MLSTGVSSTPAQNTTAQDSTAAAEAVGAPPLWGRLPDLTACQMFKESTTTADGREHCKLSRIGGVGKVLATIQRRVFQQQTAIMLAPVLLVVIVVLVVLMRRDGQTSGDRSQLDDLPTNFAKKTATSSMAGNTVICGQSRGADDAFDGW